ncbi:MAG TPA: trehalose-phosphatase [Polyangiaceae bacterium]
MKRILSPGNVEVLAQYAWSNVLLAFDFDGTLSPIVADREAARMRDVTSELFDRVCRLYPCAVISGRSREDVMRRVNGAPLRYVVGNHGLEPGPHMASFEAQVAEVRPILEQSLAALPGIDVEDKRFSIAVHYRRSRRKRDARRAIHEAVDRLPHQMRIIPGKLVVNVIPGRAPHKGDALVQLRETCRADTAVYVGDDATDEDVFALDQPGRLLSIRVGSSRTSSAAYCVPGQRDVDTLLRRLVRLREKRRP